MSAHVLLRLGKLALVASLITSVTVAQSSSQRKSTAQVAGNAEHPKFKGIFEPINYPQDIKLKDVFFTSGDNGWVVGEHSTILHTDGKTWKAEVGGDPSNQEHPINLIRALDAHHAWAIEDGPERLLSTFDGEHPLL